MTTDHQHNRDATAAEPTGRSPAPTGGPTLPTWTTGAAALGLVAIIATASGGHQPVWTAFREGSASRPAAAEEMAELVSLAIIAVVAIALIVHSFRVSRRPEGPTLARALLRRLPVAGVALALLLLMSVAMSEREPAPSGGGGALQLKWFPGLGLANDPEGSTPAAGEVELAEADVGPPGGHLGRTLLIILGLLAAAVIGGVILWWYRNRRSDAARFVDARLRGDAATEGIVEEEAETVDHEQVRDAVLGTIEAMLADPDPHTAIIGAYARLLETLAACDLERAPHEAPLEHLRRALARLRVSPEPLRLLTDLFQLARFSTHPLDEGHRDQALACLRDAAADLRVMRDSVRPRSLSTAALPGLPG